jgi:hypothetical protein
MFLGWELNHEYVTTMLDKMLENCCFLMNDLKSGRQVGVYQVLLPTPNGNWFLLISNTVA